MARKKKATWFLRLRRYPDALWVSLWLCRRDGPASSSLLFGEVLPSVAEELILALGLPVEREVAPLKIGEPITPRDCQSVAEQMLLFPE